MAAGVTDRLWSVEDLVALWEATSSGGRNTGSLRGLMIRLPVLKDELAYLEKLLPELEIRPDLVQLASDMRVRIDRIRQEIRALQEMGGDNPK